MNASPRDLRMPSIFISHGAPTLATEDGEAHRFLRAYGRRLGTPQAVLVMSAHFEAPVATVTAGSHPETIHDFGGFPEALYRIEYPAPGDPELAERVVSLLESGNIPARSNPIRGFDHGAWVPMSLMYPEADVPMIQVSLDPRRDAAYHYRLGELLRPLRAEGVLIVGSGGATHNLRELDWRGGAAGPPDWVDSFNEWLADAVLRARIDDLLDYRERAPNALRNHPTEEHFLPLPFALGAGGDTEPGMRVHHSYTFGSLSMDVYQFGDLQSVDRP